MQLETQDILWINQTIEKLKHKLESVRVRSRNKLPAIAINGVHDDRSASGIDFSIDNGINCWTNGFWCGMLWMMYSETNDQEYADIASALEGKLDDCFNLFYGLHHDVGFMYMPTAVANYRLMKNSLSRKRALHAANLLAGRFNPVGKFIRAWNELNDSKKDTRGWAIIDCMINLSLLYWASEETGDPRFRQIAMLHADTVIENFVRKDGSVCHIVEFDPETGSKRKDYGGQGYAEGSSWTRGQAWALYGFMISYLHTHEPRYLETTLMIANYFIANIPESGIIPVDFRQPIEPFVCDDTAAAIAACGLIELARNVRQWDQEMYLKHALRMLKALVEHHCDLDPSTDGITQKGMGAYNVNHPAHNIIFGDYFLTEAMLKLHNNDFMMW